MNVLNFRPYTKLSRLTLPVVLALLVLLTNTSGESSALAHTQSTDPEQAPLLSTVHEDESVIEPSTLSPYWQPSIQRWSTYIEALSKAYGFDPDFIAAVIKHESDGDEQVVSHMGAVGLMGVMPYGPGLEWRPLPDELLIPATNLRWGMLILSHVVQQSGGDLFAALAAYNGGWQQVNSREPREYASSVLDSYARAVIARNGMSPDLAAQWTIAIEVPSGNVPMEDLLILGQQPVSDTRLFGEHTVYSYTDDYGRAYYVRGYVVPVGLTEFVDNVTQPDEASALEASLQARLGDKDYQKAAQNSRVLLACLPSLTRLRGHVNTRWYSPSYCPSAQR
ncbi:MAG: transglycosylase SLT domain-containing protein [Chloroflexota bacterium]